MSSHAAYLIAKAAETIGSVEAVRTALSVRPVDFEPWRTGAVAPPRLVYERLVDLVISEQVKLIERLQREQREAAARAEIRSAESGARMTVTIRLPF